jgi:IS5 family transposase
VQEKQVK